MRLNTSAPAFLALSSLIELSTALPFFHRRAFSLQSLVRRATYSVVPVDGGPIATDAPQETVVRTVVQTEPPKTTTILQTDNVTLPPVTNYVVTTKTLEGPNEVHTVVVIITPTPKVAITTSYSIIDVNSPLDTTQVGSDEPTSTLISSSYLSTSTFALSTSPTSTSSSPTLLPSSKSASQTTPSPIISSTAVSSSSSSASITTTSTSTTSLSTSTTSLSTSTTRTFDDGHWRTYYPAWNDTRTVGAYVRAVQAASSTSLPTLAPAALQSSQEARTNPAAKEQDIAGGSIVETKDVNVEASSAPRSLIARLLAISGAWLR